MEQSNLVKGGIALLVCIARW